MSQNSQSSTHRVRAAVLEEPGKKLAIRTLDLGGPQHGEVRVKVEAAGVCHSDYHYMSKSLQCPLPAVLGHEGAGVVLEVGSGVDSVKVGDHVLFIWRPSCGHCEYCSTGRPVLCSFGQAIRSTGRLADGTTRWRDGSNDVHHFLGVSCFAEQTVCPANAVHKIDSDIPFAVASLAGCALMSGVGAVVNTAKVAAGSTVLIIGAGGVGLCAVMGSQLVGAGRIIVADRLTSRLEAAMRLGATDVVLVEDDLVGAVRRLEPDGVDFSFEMVGNPQVLKDAVGSLRRGGTATAVGLAPLGSEAPINPTTLVLYELTIKGSLYGSTRPYRDFPALFQLYRAGRLPLERFEITEFGLPDINTAFDEMLAGRVDRAIIRPSA